MPKFKITLSRNIAQLASFVVEAPSAELAWEILADAELDVESLPWKDWGADR